MQVWGLHSVFSKLLDFCKINNDSLYNGFEFNNRKDVIFYSLNHIPFHILNNLKHGPNKDHLIKYLHLLHISYNIDLKAEDTLFIFYT